MPAKAGIQFRQHGIESALPMVFDWIPAFAGMTSF